MPWAAMSDDVHCDERTHRAGGAGMGLWAVCRSWIADRLTDGFIPASTARAQALALEIDPDEAIARLLASGRWVAVEGGYRDVDYLDNNPTRLAVEAKRAATAARVGACRNRKKSTVVEGMQVSTRNGVTNAVTNGVSNAGSNSVGNGPVTRAPLSPLPSPSAPKSASAYVPSERVPSDPLAQELLAELRRHPCLAEVATATLAETLAMRAHEAAKRPEDVRRAVTEAANDEAVKAAVGRPSEAAALAKLIGRYCANAAPPKVNGHHGPNGTTPGGRPKKPGRTYNAL